MERVGEKARRQQRQPEYEQPFAGSGPAPAHDDNLRHVAVPRQQGHGPRRRSQHELNEGVHCPPPGFQPPGSFASQSLSPPPNATNPSASDCDSPPLIAICAWSPREPHSQTFAVASRSEEHTSELQSLLRISY